jgi:hypothetical protein
MALLLDHASSGDRERNLIQPSIPTQVMAVLLDHFVAATAVEKRMALRTDEEAALRKRVGKREGAGG